MNFLLLYYWIGELLNYSIIELLPSSAPAPTPTLVGAELVIVSAYPATHPEKYEIATLEQSVYKINCYTIREGNKNYFVPYSHS